MRKISFCAAGLAVLILIGVGTWIGVGTLSSHQRACWFGYRSISDDDKCKGAAHFPVC